MIITDLTQLKQVARDYRNQDKTIAWTNGCFDIMHPGHIETFKIAKDMADILIVGINGDQSPYRNNKPGRPINNQDFRTRMLDALKMIDHVFVYQESDPLVPVQAITPDALVKGGDYTIQTSPEAKIVHDHGGQVNFIPIIGAYSTTKIVNKVLEVYKK